jgi:hypothetical protein
MLEDAEIRGFEKIVAWQLGGCAFKVIEKDAFVRQILPKYCKQTSYKSFLRQVNLYGFSRISMSQAKGGHAGGSYYHKAFRRGERQKASRMEKIDREHAKISSFISHGAPPSSNNTSLPSLSLQGMKHPPSSSSLESAIKSEAESSMEDKKLPPATAVARFTDATTMHHSGDYSIGDENNDLSDQQEIDFDSLDGGGHDAGVTRARSTIYGIYTKANNTPPWEAHHSAKTKEAIPPGYSSVFDVSPHHDLDTAKNLIESVDLFKHDESSSGSSTAPLPERTRS